MVAFLPPWTPNPYSFPQRYVLGIDQEKSLPFISNPRRAFQNSFGRSVELGTTGYDPEIKTYGATTPTALKSENVPEFAYQLFMNSGSLPHPRVNLPGGGSQPFISAGTGTTQARVNQPQSEAEAKRNLNFAIANLAAYQQWEKVTAPALEREAKAKAKAEAEEKRQAEARLVALEAKQKARNKAGLDLFNNVNSTRHMTWGTVYHAPLSIREKWADKAEEIAKLRRDSNPFSEMAKAINTAAISSAQLRNYIGY